MKRLTARLLIFTLLLAPSAYSQECFLVKEQDKVIKNEGECKQAFAPHSTFKIALSLMGFDSKILIDETSPSFPFKLETSPGINVCRGDHNAKAWMRDSCVWFSQVLTAKLGREKFRKYVGDFSYGNKDVSGDPGKNNGLMRALDQEMRLSISFGI